MCPGSSGCARMFTAQPRAEFGKSFSKLTAALRAEAQATGRPRFSKSPLAILSDSLSGAYSVLFSIINSTMQFCAGVGTERLKWQAAFVLGGR